jgi:hypothetical protein
MFTLYIVGYLTCLFFTAVFLLDRPEGYKSSGPHETLTLCSIGVIISTLWPVVVLVLIWIYGYSAWIWWEAHRKS